MCAVRCVGEMVFSGIAPGGQRNCRGDFETPTRAFRINAKSCGRLPIALPEVLSERGLRRTATTPKKWGWAGVRVVVLWEGEAAAEPSVCQARGSCGSAGASPSRRGCRLGRSLALPRGCRLGRSLALPRGCRLGGSLALSRGCRLGGSLALPRGWRLGGSLALPRGWRLGGSLALPRGLPARQEPRPPEGVSHALADSDASAIGAWRGSKTSSRRALHFT